MTHVGIETRIEGESHEGVQRVREAGLEHRVDEVVDEEVLDSHGGIAGDTWGRVRTEARRNGKVEREWQWQKFEICWCCAQEHGLR